MRPAVTVTSWNMLPKKGLAHAFQQRCWLSMPMAYAAAFSLAKCCSFTLAATAGGNAAWFCWKRNIIFLLARLYTSFLCDVCGGLCFVIPGNGNAAFLSSCKVSGICSIFCWRFVIFGASTLCYGTGRSYICVRKNMAGTYVQQALHARKKVQTAFYRCLYLQESDLF